MAGIDTLAALLTPVLRESRRALDFMARQVGKRSHLGVCAILIVALALFTTQHSYGQSSVSDDAANSMTLVRYQGYVFRVNRQHIDQPSRKSGDTLWETKFWIKLPEWLPPAPGMRRIVSKAGDLAALALTRTDKENVDGSGSARLLFGSSDPGPWMKPDESSHGLWHSRGSILHYYAERSGQNVVSWMTCTPTASDAAYCTHKFRWEKFVVTLTYPSSLLKSWRELEQGAGQFLKTSVLDRPDAAETERQSILVDESDTILFTAQSRLPPRRSRASRVRLGGRWSVSAATPRPREERGVTPPARYGAI